MEEQLEKKHYTIHHDDETSVVRVPVDATNAFELVTGLREAIKSEASSFISIGMFLYYLKIDKQYKKLGHKTMNDLYHDEGMSRASGNNYLRVYEKLHPYMSNMIDKSIPHRRMIDILNAINKVPENEIPALIEGAGELSYSDFTDSIRVAKGKESQLDCDHEVQELWVRCSTCSKWLRKQEG
jgi:hypothetical protein